MPISVDTERFRDKINPELRKILDRVAELEAKVEDWEDAESIKKGLLKEEEAELLILYYPINRNLLKQVDEQYTKIQELVTRNAVLQDDADILKEDVQSLIAAARIYFVAG